MRSDSFMLTASPRKLAHLAMKSAWSIVPRVLTPRIIAYRPGGSGNGMSFSPERPQGAPPVDQGSGVSGDFGQKGGSQDQGALNSRCQHHRNRYRYHRDQMDRCHRADSSGSGILGNLFHRCVSPSCIGGPTYRNQESGRRRDGGWQSGQPVDSPLAQKRWRHGGIPQRTRRRKNTSSKRSSAVVSIHMPIPGAATCDGPVGPGNGLCVSDSSAQPHRIGTD